MAPDMATVRETGIFVRTVWPWVKKFFSFRSRLAEKIDIDIASGSHAVRVDLANATHAIDVSLRVSNFSAFFPLKLRSVTGYITMKSKEHNQQIIFRETISRCDKVPHGRPVSVQCQFKLSDSQERAVRAFNQCPDLEVGVMIDAEMSSLWGTIHKSMSIRDVLVKSWYQPSDK
jgi:hypothetical protein